VRCQALVDAEDSVAMGFRPRQVGLSTCNCKRTTEATQLEVGWPCKGRADSTVTLWSYKKCGEQPGLLCPHMAHNQHWPLAPTLSQSLTSETVHVPEIYFYARRSYSMSHTLFRTSNDRQ